MADVLVTWTTQDKPVATPADHFVVTCGVQEQNAALTETQSLFHGVPDGTIALAVTLVDAGNNQLAPPITGSVVVVSPILGPTPITVQGVVQ